MEPLFVVFAFVFGTMIGSFLNVCIYRLPLGQSVAFPGSHCGACQKPVRWHDNVPILSYLLLGGKCRDCKTGFSQQYLWIEALTGAIFVLFYVRFGISAGSLLLLAFTLAMLVQTMIDFKHKIIPDVITLPGIVIGLAGSALVPALHGQADWRGGLWQAFLGLLVGGGFLYALAVIAEFVLKKEAMGGGDVKLLAMIGAFLGIPGVAWTLFAGSFSGAIVGGFYRAVKKEEQIPFGPFLGAAAVAYIFFGETVINWYFGAFAAR